MMTRRPKPEAKQSITCLFQQGYSKRLCKEPVPWVLGMGFLAMFWAPLSAVSHSYPMHGPMDPSQESLTARTTSIVSLWLSTLKAEYEQHMIRNAGSSQQIIFEPLVSGSLSWCLNSLMGVLRLR